MRACGQSCAVRGVGRPRTGRRPDASRHLARHAHGHQMGTQQPAGPGMGPGGQARPAHGPAAHPAAFWPTSPQRHPTRGRLSAPWTPLGCGEARRAPARRFLALPFLAPKQEVSRTLHLHQPLRKKNGSLYARCSVDGSRHARPGRPHAGGCHRGGRRPAAAAAHQGAPDADDPPIHARTRHTRNIMNALLGSHSVLGCGIGLCSECRLSHVLPRYSCACRRCALATRPLPVTCRLTR